MEDYIYLYPLYFNVVYNVKELRPMNFNSFSLKICLNVLFCITFRVQAFLRHSFMAEDSGSLCHRLGESLQREYEMYLTNVIKKNPTSVTVFIIQPRS